MNLLYQEATEEVAKSERLVIIGSRLREEDYMLWFILSYFNSQKNKIYILGPEAELIRDDLIDNFRTPEENINLIVGKLSDRIQDLAGELNKA